ncbi:MAG TPA: septal ring lytic transglycosylase RlpA family protein [Solirubrobacterales bacterium]|jgi:rare lipoprotein A (peptidoglycan hydrolase)|nr:septal ring lytic transglycosylase RlpA family protein [Solirubrobacterales bacterium]
MSQFPPRRKATTDLTGAAPLGRSVTWLCAALLAGALAVLALAVVPGAQASTGGAASAAPIPIEATPGAPTATTAFDEAELSFTPLRYAGASWYGGKTMWGRSTACGQVLRPSTIGVANKRLPCGTPVKFVWHGNSIVAPVIDRGPYVKGRAWDLTAAAAEALGFEGIGRIQYAVAIEYARANTR